MTRFALDASVALSWCFEDEDGPYPSGVLDALRTSGAVAPTLWVFEVVNGMVTAERRRRLLARDSKDLLRLIFELPIEIEPDPPAHSILEVARESGLSAYDAAYLELAVRRGLPLATVDKQLQAAAKNAGVEIFRPE